MPRVAISNSFVSKQRQREVPVAASVEYRLVGLHIHILLPGKTPIVLSRPEFSERLSDGSLEIVG